MEGFVLFILFVSLVAFIYEPMNRRTEEEERLYKSAGRY